MRKSIIIISFILFIGAVIVGLVAYFRRPQSPAALPPNGTVATTPTILPPLSPASIDAFLKASNFPTGDTITLGTPKGGVVVKNFYKTIVDTEEGFVWIRDNDDYRISYNTADSNFYIDIFSQPFDMARKKAEKDFLDILDISQSDACKLKVVEFAPADEANLAGGNLRLSFCIPHP
jgi:hypothetical protein